MIHIDFDPTKLTDEQLTWWTAWEGTAAKGTKEVVEAWETWWNGPKDTSFGSIFDRADLKKIWTDLKNWLLLNVFNEKCAYCETPMVRATLHAEHYWPKGRVNINNKRVTIKDDLGQDHNHPGYFWLAFHWTNLLPACEWCNTVNGKRNEFPIPQTTYLSILKKLTKAECNSLKQKMIRSNNWPDIFYFQPIDLDDKEGRLLLHPYFDDPSKCLTFDDFGKVIEIGNKADKERGKASIQIYNLNDERIKTERQRAQEEALTIYDTKTKSYRMDGMSLKDAKLKAKEHLAPYVKGQKPYSAAVLDYLRLEDPTYFK